MDLGLGYLSLERSTPTLSPGELQRLRIGTQVHSNLFGVVYVLDEPSAGLHPADTVSLLRALDRLKAAGNSIFVIEHELDVMRHADWIVDVGPDAGQHGGQVLYSGPVEGLRDVKESRTPRVPVRRDSPATGRARRVEGLAPARERHPEQRARSRRGLPARRFHDRDRRLGVGEVELGEPGAGGAGAAAPGARGGAAGG